MVLPANFPPLPYAVAVLAVMVPVLVLSVKRKKLTPAAGCTAVILGLLVMAMGLESALMLIGFFVMGVWATRHQQSKKAQIRVGAAHTESRNALQVLANGGVAGLCGLLSIFDIERMELYQLMAAGSLAAASADTVSSELGIVYGKRTINILTLKKEPAGLDGVISLEGTLAGLAAAAVIAAIAGIAEGLTWKPVLILIAGFTGNLVDSVLGASIERKRYVGNDFVNACNTFSGALIAWALFCW